MEFANRDHAVRGGAATYDTAAFAAAFVLRRL